MLIVYSTAATPRSPKVVEEDLESKIAVNNSLPVFDVNMVLIVVFAKQLAKLTSVFQKFKQQTLY